MSGRRGNAIRMTRRVYRCSPWQQGMAGLVRTGFLRAIELPCATSGLPIDLRLLPIDAPHAGQHQGLAPVEPGPGPLQGFAPFRDQSHRLVDPGVAASPKLTPPLTEL